MTEFLVGVGVAVLGLLPGVIALFLVLRFVLRNASRQQTVADAWRVAATNATILARVHEILQQKKEDEDDEKVLHGG